MGQPVCRIVANVSTGGMAAQVVEAALAPEARISNANSTLVALLRLRPRKLEAKVWAEGSRRAQLGELAAIPPDLPIQAQASGIQEMARSVVCHFDKEWIDTLVEHAPLLDQPYCDLRNPELHGAMSRLGRELTSPHGCNELLVQCMSTEVAILLLRHMEKDRGQSPIKGEASRLSTQQLKSIFSFVEASADTPTLADISENCGLSSGYLQRMFKNSTGRTLYSLLNDVRMSRAKTFLADTDLPIKEIAFRLNFCEQSAFAAAFKKQTGDTPRNFRLRSRWTRLC